MFRVINNHGFHLEFSNGIYISCQISNNDFCDNYLKPVKPLNNGLFEVYQCNNCEVAIIDKAGNSIAPEIFKELNIEHNFGHDTVAGYVDAETVAKLIAYLSTRA